MVTVTHQNIPAEKVKWVNFSIVQKNKIIASCSLGGFDGQCPCLQNVFVDKKHRRKGFAAKLINKAMDVAEKAKKKSIYLVVSKKNKGALKLYKELDFKISSDDSTRWWMSVPLCQ